MRRRDFIATAAGAGFLGLYAGPVLAQGAPVAPSPPNGKAKDSKAATIVVVGDSLSAEYGLRRGTGWVALLQKKLAQESIPARVINASISGDTTSGGRARLGDVLAQHRPSHVIIELGGNDALRGLSLKATKDNLDQMTRAAQRAGAKVVLVGMQVPPNYGTAYSDEFAGLFGQVASATNATLVPFLLKGVADVDDPTQLFQSDRIHPTAQAQPTMLANVWPHVRKLLP